MDTKPDTKPAPTPTATALPRWRAWLPWAIASATSIAALLLLIVILARPAPAPAAPVVQAVPLPEPSVTWAQSKNAYLQTWRDKDGGLLALSHLVVPSHGEDVWCRLVVDGRTIEVHATDGQPAICVWIRGAA